MNKLIIHRQNPNIKINKLYTEYNRDPILSKSDIELHYFILVELEFDNMTHDEFVTHLTNNINEIPLYTNTKVGDVIEIPTLDIYYAMDYPIHQIIINH